MSLFKLSLFDKDKKDLHDLLASLGKVQFNMVKGTVHVFRDPPAKLEWHV